MKSKNELQITKEGKYWIVNYKGYSDFGDTVEDAMANLIMALELLVDSQEQMGGDKIDLTKSIRDSSDNRCQGAVKQTISHTPDNNNLIKNALNKDYGADCGYGGNS